MAIHKQKKNVDNNYFNAYGNFDTQSWMLDDRVRTGAYYEAIVGNPELFSDKVVMDVGTGTGVLAIFAARAGAKKVYAIEASPKMAEAAKKLIKENHLEQVITVICGKIEDVAIPECVDIIVSEPMGYFLLNEQMLQSYLWASQHYLKPGGMLFPAEAYLYAAPIDASILRQRVDNNCRRWLDKEDFFSINYQSFYFLAKHHETSRTHIDQILPEHVIGVESCLSINFYEMTSESLSQVILDMPIQLPRTRLIKDIGLWFDVVFPKNQAGQSVTLTTAPTAKPTHWYQTILLLDEPVYGGDSLQINFNINALRCYDIEIYSKDRQELVKKISSTNIKYDYNDHYNELNLTPASQFGYE